MTVSAQGEDRSNHNPVTGWGTLSFGFVKATEGLTFTDATFSRNWANLKAAGKPRGAYHFLHPDVSPFLQAEKFMAVVEHAGLDEGDMLVVDSETLAANVDSVTKTFLDQVKAIAGSHHPVLTYTNHNVGQHLHQTAAAYPELWFAYPASAAPAAALYAPWKTWRFWQWGIVGGLDKDAYNGTQAELLAWLKTYLPAPHAGPYRHLTDGTHSLAELAALRHESIAALVSNSARHYTAADLAELEAAMAHATLPKGIPWYTEKA